MTWRAPIQDATTLEAANAPAVRGRLLGRCAGPVLLQAVSGNQERPIAASQEVAGREFSMRVPMGVSFTLRWGCDADGDGVVPAEATASSSVAALSRDLPLELRVLDPQRLAGFDVSVPRIATRSLLPATGAAGPPLPGMLGPADAIAPADGAVGPPLPNGPPPDAGPPPPSGVGPPI